MKVTIFLVRGFLRTHSFGLNPKNPKHASMVYGFVADRPPSELAGSFIQAKAALTGRKGFRVILYNNEKKTSTLK